MLAPHDQIAVNTLFILLLITGFGYWILVKYYSMAERIENLEEELDNKYPVIQSTINNEVKRDIEMLITDLIKHEDRLLTLDNKYKIDNEWNVAKFEEIVDILENSKQFLTEPTMAQASEIEADA
tara:strand:- start:300 stop:674 length:375 start_codon:yes stop_codon:yes gene_type:complete